MSDLKSKISTYAHQLGFSGVTYAKAEFMDDEARRLEAWLNQGYHGSMGYMENHFDKRVDPTQLVPGAKTVISFLYNYYNPASQVDEEAPKIAMYAYGRDYHKVVKKKLKQVFNFIREEVGAVEGRYFVDSAPVLERDWAKRSGLGWTGKNTLLLTKQKGSYFFLAEIICDIEVPYDHPIADHCGTCTRCIDACPTDAISPEGYLLDGSKCISYLTIERKDEIPPEFRDTMNGWAFGCDICQQVCPWNRFSSPHEEPDFLPKPEMMNMTKEEWEEMHEDTFERLFNGTPVRRAGFKKLKETIRFLKT